MGGSELLGPLFLELGDEDGTGQVAEAVVGGGAHIEQAVECGDDANNLSGKGESFDHD